MLDLQFCNLFWSILSLCAGSIVKECGLGLTPSGYYMCAIAGGIDRIYGYNLGRKKLPEESDLLSDQMSAFCRLCGHFGFQWPTRRSRQSKTWRMAYGRFDGDNSYETALECRMSNDEWWIRFALTILVRIKSIEYLTSKFMIPCSIFDIRFFEVSFIDQTGRFFGQRQRSCETTQKWRFQVSGFRCQVSGVRILRPNSLSPEILYKQQITEA